MECSMIEFYFTLALILFSVFVCVWIIKQYTKAVVWFMKNIYTDQDEKPTAAITTVDTIQK